MNREFAGKRVTVMGLGRFGGGVGVTRWLVGQGARVLVTDREPAEKLADSVEQVRLPEVTLRLGEHRREDFTDTDFVVVNPAVPDSSEFVQAARQAGVAITTEINLFVERCRGTMVGITGSVGKSTTTAMTAHLLEKTLAGRRVWVGGNLGMSLLDSIANIAERDVVVLELSSFQLERTPLVRWSPHIAAITNISPNHIDWHGSYAAYCAAKLNIVRFQKPERDEIIIGDVPNLREMFDQMFGDVSGIWRAGLDGAAPRAVQQSTPAVDCDDRRVAWPSVALGVPGSHNRQNAAVALAIGHTLGVDGDAGCAALGDFYGLPHRLQRVTIREGVTYFNDSKSTTPESAITAMNAIEGSLIVILGGYDKGSDLTPAARVAAQRARFAACLGQTGATVAAQVRSAGGNAEVFDTIEAAVGACRSMARPGDTVLLSPACASWDMFTDYRERGERFAKLVCNG